jgi:hypothetical protein
VIASSGVATGGGSVTAARLRVVVLATVSFS